MPRMQGADRVVQEEKCPQCGKEISLNKLARHIKEVHDNVRKHCPFCPKMFHATNLKKHIRDVHHGVKVKCPLCPKHFPSSSLKTHIRGVHYRDRKKCPHCPQNIHPNGCTAHQKNSQGSLICDFVQGVPKKSNFLKFQDRKCIWKIWTVLDHVR